MRKKIFLITLLITTPVILVSIIGFFSSFITTPDMTFPNYNEVEVSTLRSMDLIRYALDDITSSHGQLNSFEGIVYSVSIMYIALIVISVVAFIHLLAKVKRHNTKSISRVVVLNAVLAALSVALMISYFVMKSMVIKEGLYEEFRAQSFTVAMAIINIVLTAASFLMIKFFPWRELAANQ